MKKFILYFLCILVALIAIGKCSLNKIHENDKRRAVESERIREELKRKDKEYKEKLAKEDASRTLYDPELCKNDAEGMVYYAAGNHVFRFPYQKDNPLYSRKNTRFASPISIPNIDETELEGCPDNPLHGGAVPYSDAFIKSYWKELSGKKHSDSLLRGTGIRAVERRLLHSIEYPPQLF